LLFGRKKEEHTSKPTSSCLTDQNDCVNRAVTKIVANAPAKLVASTAQPRCDPRWPNLVAQFAMTERYRYYCASCVSRLSDIQAGAISKLEKRKKGKNGGERVGGKIRTATLSRKKERSRKHSSHSEKCEQGTKGKIVVIGKNVIPTTFPEGFADPPPSPSKQSERS
jgi:hypothetical protein